MFFPFYREIFIYIANLVIEGAKHTALSKVERVQKVYFYAKNGGDNDKRYIFSREYTPHF